MTANEKNLSHTQASQQTIGLLGGAFDPAHEGHLHLCQAALEHLPIDEVWWIVADNHPLKSTHQPFIQRFEAAKQLLANELLITPSAIEHEAKTRYTIDTLNHLRKNHPSTHFIWLMGDDVTEGFAQWKDYKQIINSTPIAVFTRNHEEILPKTVFTTDYAAYKQKHAKGLLSPAPCWYHVDIIPKKISSTHIREGKITQKQDRA